MERSWADGQGRLWCKFPWMAAACRLTTTPQMETWAVTFPGSGQVPSSPPHQLFPVQTLLRASLTCACGATPPASPFPAPGP